VAFFGAAGTGARKKIHAWMSHSSQGLRAILQQEHDVKFELPIAPNSGQRLDLSQEHQAELTELGQVVPLVSSIFLTNVYLAVPNPCLQRVLICIILSRTMHLPAWLEILI
jgi:hypothetical protein